MKNDDEYNEFLFLMSQLARKLNILDRDEKLCYGVTVQQSYIIEVLCRHGSLTMNELSKKVGVAVSTMTRICDVIVRNGITKRRINPADRRQIYMELTEHGRDLAVKLRKCCQAYSQEVLDQIPPEKREEVLESIDLLNKAVESVKQKCCS
jgi:DNA-binding MarR family transcriptional regulator